MRHEAYVTLAAIEHDWGRAWMSRDAATCAEMIADDYVEIAANGRFASKSEWIAALPFRAPRQVHWLDIRVRPLGRCAVVHGRLRLLGSANGHDHRDNFVATDIWVWRDERWQIVSRQLTAAHAHGSDTLPAADPARAAPASFGNVH